MSFISQKITQHLSPAIGLDVFFKLISAISNVDHNLISNIKVFDVYEGDNIPENQKSVAISVTIQSFEKTLDENDFNPYEFLSESNTLFDLIYNPIKSSFLNKGQKMGCKIQNGLEMLEIQAEESWKIWNSPN